MYLALFFFQLCAFHFPRCFGLTCCLSLAVSNLFLQCVFIVRCSVPWFMLNIVYLDFNSPTTFSHTFVSIDFHGKHMNDYASKCTNHSRSGIKSICQNLSPVIHYLSMSCSHKRFYVPNLMVVKWFSSDRFGSSV